jgi:hypothetical protein
MQKPFPHDPQHWRLRAEEARVHLELISDPDAKRAMLEIADRYALIAKRAEQRIEDLEKHPPASSIRRSIRRKRWF